MFPKIIHQIWFDFGTKGLSNEHKYLIEHTKTQASESGFEYKLWTYESATEFILENYPYFAYFLLKDSKFKITKCDFFRYVLMFHFGGIYIDLDFYILKPLNRLYDDIKTDRLNLGYCKTNILLTEEWYNSARTDSGSFHNGFLLSTAKQYFWLFLLCDISMLTNDENDFTCNQDVWNKTGTRKLRTHFFTENQNNPAIKYLPYYYICPYKCIEKKTKHTILCANSNTIPYDLIKGDWCFFSLDELLTSLEDPTESLLPNSYMACVYLRAGSLWL